MRTLASTIHVENVVYEPRKPIAANGRTNCVGGQRSMTSVSRTPSTKLPVMFTVSVDHGNVPGATWIARLRP